MTWQAYDSVFAANLLPITARINNLLFQDVVLRNDNAASNFDFKSELV